jgi:hypothetical protein
MVILISIVLPAISKVRQRAADDKRQNDINSISLAIKNYEDIYRKMPDNYNCASFSGGILSGHPMCGSAGAPTKAYVACDAPLNEMEGGVDTIVDPAAYNASMQELVDAMVLKKIPHSQGGPGYCYYDAGPGTGAIIMTELPSTEASQTGLDGSCRPYSGMTEICTTDHSTHQYCRCLPPGI